MDIEKEITDHHRGKVPSDIAELACRAQTDLYSGPLYLNEEDEVVSMYDEGYVKAFDFANACKVLSDWCGDNLDTLYYEANTGCMLTAEPEPWEDDDGVVHDEWVECYEVSPALIKKTLFGKELANHL